MIRRHQHAQEESSSGAASSHEYYYDSEDDEGEDAEGNGGLDNSIDSAVSGVPWYLVDGEAFALEGVKIDYSKPEDIA